MRIKQNELQTENLVKKYSDSCSTLFPVQMSSSVSTGRPPTEFSPNLLLEKKKKPIFLFPE